MSESALKTVAEVTEEHGPRFVAPDVLLLEKLGLSLRVRSEGGPGAQLGLFIGVFEAFTEGQRTGIGVTCVGMPPDSVKDAVANWCLGVLPVLVHWRGGHTCFVGTSTFGTDSAGFEVIKGPIIARGESEGGAPPSTDTYLELLSEPLGKARLKNRLHWLECYAVRMSDGSVEATCRLDNKNWSPGQRLLIDEAQTWPGSTSSFDSRRQFLLLVPQSPGEPERPSFLSRLFGRG